MSKLPTLILILSALSAAADYKAGVARVLITPEKPMYLSGYANRTHASEGKIHDLWAKALAIEDRKGGRIVIAINADGEIFWNGKKITCKELNARMRAMAVSVDDGLTTTKPLE